VEENRIPSSGKAKDFLKNREVNKKILEEELKKV